MTEILKNRLSIKSFTPLGKKMKCEYLSHKFDKIYTKNKLLKGLKNQDFLKKENLFQKQIRKTLWAMIRGDYYRVLFLSFVSEGCLNYFIYSLRLYSQSYKAEKEEKGSGLQSMIMVGSGAIACVFIGYLTKEHYLKIQKRIGARVGQTMRGLLYRKLSKSSKNTLSYINPGFIIKYLFYEFDSISKYYASLPEKMVLPMTVFINMITLFQIVGFQAVLIVPVVFIIGIFLSILEYKKMNRKKMLKKVAWTRTELISEFLPKLKTVKINSLEDFFLNRLWKIRSSQIKLLNDYNFSQTLSNFLLYLTPTLASFLTIVVLITTANSFPSAVAFTLVTLMNRLYNPLKNAAGFIESKVNFEMALKSLNTFLNGLYDLPRRSENQIEDKPLLGSKIIWMKDPHVISEDADPKEVKILMDKIFEADRNADKKHLESGQLSVTQDQALLKKMTHVLFGGGGSNQRLLHRSTFSFGSAKPKKILFEGIEIRHGQKIAVFDPERDSYSVFIKTIIGEIMTNHKSIDLNIKGKISYMNLENSCFFEGKSLRENILLNEEYNEKHYNHVLSMVNLDLESLPGRDFIQLAEQGRNIQSHILKQILLARFLYPNKDIYILDRYIDDTTKKEKEMLKKIIFDSYLKKKTVIFVSKNMEFLEKSDNVMIFKNYQMKEKGKFKNLKENPESPAYVIFYKEMKKRRQNKIFTYGIQKIREEEGEDEEIKSVSKSKSNKFNNSDKSDDENDLDKEKDHKKFKNPFAKKSPKRFGTRMMKKFIDRKKLEKSGELYEKEKMNSFSPWKVLLKFMSLSGKFQILLWALLFIFSSFLFIFGDIWLGLWSGDVLSFTETQYMIYYGLVTFLAAVFIILRDHVFRINFRSLSDKLNRLLLEHLMDLKLDWLSRNPSSRIFSKITRDQMLIDEDLNSITLTAFANAMNLLVGILVVNYVYRGIFIVFTIIMLAYLRYLLKTYSKISAPLTTVQASLKTDLYQTYVESIRSFPTMRVNHCDTYLSERFFEMSDKYQCVTSHIFNLSMRWLCLRLAFLTTSIQAVNYLGPVVLILLFRETMLDYTWENLLAMAWIIKTNNSLIRMVFNLALCYNRIISLERLFQFIKNEEGESQELETFKKKKELKAKGDGGPDDDDDDKGDDQDENKGDDKDKDKEGDGSKSVSQIQDSPRKPGIISNRKKNEIIMPLSSRDRRKVNKPLFQPLSSRFKKKPNDLEFQQLSPRKIEKKSNILEINNYSKKDNLSNSKQSKQSKVSKQSKLSKSDNSSNSSSRSSNSSAYPKSPRSKIPFFSLDSVTLSLHKKPNALQINNLIFDKNRVAIVGSSGSGRNLLVEVMMGLHCTNLSEDSKILFKGENILYMSKRSLRKIMMHLSCHPYVYSGSIDSNIDPYQKYTQNEKKRVLSYLKLSDYFNAIKSQTKEKDKGLEGLQKAHTNILSKIKGIRNKKRESPSVSIESKGKFFCKF